MTATSDPAQITELAARAADNRVNLDFETEGMTLNIGPQHPATHGTLRIVARLDGEQVVSAEPIPGYMHRGYEKLTEVRTYPQITTLINRIDWLGSFANEVPFILAAEKLMGVEAPPRAQYIRTILFEMTRIANISLFLGDLRRPARRHDRRLLRLPRPRARPQPDRGRDRRPLPPQLRPHRRPEGRPAQGLDRRDRRPPWTSCGPSATRSKTLLIGNEIFQTRTRGIGVIPADVAMSYGLSGANIRGSGVDWDLRRDSCPPGLVYDQADWKVWTHPDGDSFGRSWVRLQETREAPRSSTSCSTRIPSGPIMAKVPRIIKVPEGEAYVATENPLGEMGYYIVSKGDLVPFRVKIRSASFSNVSIVPWVTRGVYVPDVITILGLPLLHPGGHRPMTRHLLASFDPPYWQSTAHQGARHQRRGPAPPR